MRLVVPVAILLLLAGVFIAAVMILSPLRVFNALVPVDRGVSRVAEGIAYGTSARQKLDIYRPQTQASDLPVLIFCYGGAWNTGDRALYDFVGRAFAARGFLTIVYDYRLVPEARFPAFIEDTAAVIAWAHGNAEKHGGSASMGLFLTGHSAGGYNVALAALDGRYLAAHDLQRSVVTGVATLAGPFDFLPLDDPDTIAAFGDNAEPTETQPVNAVNRQAPPFLLLTGDADSTVGPYNSRNLKRKLDAAGVPAQLVLYPGLGHADVLTALARPLRWRAPVLDDISRFFEGLQASAKRS